MSESSGVHKRIELLESKIDILSEALASKDSHIEDLRKTVADLREQLTESKQRVVTLERVFLGPMFDRYSRNAQQAERDEALRDELRNVGSSLEGPFISHAAKKRTFGVVDT